MPINNAVNTNIAALIAHRGLLRANADLNLRLERLSTGLRLNRASDDPAGMVKADRLSMELRGLNAAVDAAERGGTMIAAIDGQLAAIADRLETLKTLVAEQGDSSTLSPGDRQLAIDAELAGIEAIANSAVFGGRRLLDGSLGYNLTPINTAMIPQMHVHSADVALRQISIALDVLVPAEKGVLFAPLNSGSFLAGVLTEDVTLEIGGPKGVKTLSFLAGATAANMATAINQMTLQTGVQAVSGVSGGVNVLEFHTVDYGSDQTVKVQAVTGTGINWDTVVTVGGASAIMDSGVDVGGWVNGIPWVGQGLKAHFNTPAISFTATLSEAFATNTAIAAQNISILGGGASFQVGLGSTSNDRVSFGLGAVIPSQLGYTLDMTGAPLLLSMLASGKPLAVGGVGGPTDSVRVVEAAIAELSATRARLGAVDQTRLTGALESLQSAIESAASAESQIRDADIAAETAALVRAQILSEASISMLGAANRNAEALLRLLNR